MRTSSYTAPPTRMRTYKPPQAAGAAVAPYSQFGQQPFTHQYIFPFLKLATLSFAIPPPISASVRSRQAGTETEREASAMEALGPGKKNRTKRGAERTFRVSGVCAQMRRFTGGRGCSEASTHWGENKTEGGPARMSVYIRVWHYLYDWRPPSVRVEGRLAVIDRISNYVWALVFIWSTHCSSCWGWHCVSGDLTRTFLPPSFRVVVCLRWCLFVVVCYSFRHKPLRPRSYDSIEMCQYFLLRFVPRVARACLNLNPRHRGRRVSSRQAVRPRRVQDESKTRAIGKQNESHVNMSPSRSEQACVFCDISQFSMRASHLAAAASLLVLSRDGWRLYRSDE